MTRKLADSSPLHVRFGEFDLDEANALLTCSGRPIDLAPTPFGLLCTLVRRPGSLLTKHILLDEVWGHRFVSDSVVKTAISDLRSALLDDPRQPRYIETVARRGYRFIAVPTAVSAAEASPTRASVIDEPHASPFIGRGKELSDLRGAWERASRGKRAVVWIAGEPGIGKTTLIERFVSSLGEVACARGYCVEHYGSGEPYLPVLEALGELCRTDEALPPLLRSIAPTWLLQLPWLSTEEQRERLRRELVGVGPERMLREMGELLDRYTGHRSLLLVTEDLHWADRATTQLIDYIARRRGSSRLMWLASFRLAEVVASDHPLNGLRRELRLHGLSEEIVLDPFSETEVAQYLAERSPSMGGDESIARALHERTDGIPLFIASVTTDVIARAAESGAAAGDAVQIANATVPENLTAIIDHYILKLGAERRSFLSAAAVCGIDFRIETLSRVLELDAAAVAHVCDELVREQLWLVVPSDIKDSQDETYSFRHALFREVLYERTTPLARAELHRKVGTALEQERAAGLSVAVAELAMHFDRGRSPMPALRYYAQAADSALSHLSPAESMSLTERALSFLDRAPVSAERSSLEITLATLRGLAAFHILGAGNEPKAAFQRAASLLCDHPSHPMRARLLHGLGFLLNLRAEYMQALVIAGHAKALADKTDDRLLQLAAYTVQAQVHMHQGRPRLARETLERALTTADSADAAAEQSFLADPHVTLLATLSLQLLHLGFVTQARERLQHAYARARRLSQPTSLMLTIWFDALCEIRHDNVERVAALADEMQTLVEEFSLAQGKTACRFFRGWSDARRGKALESFRQIREAYEEHTALGMIAGASETLGYAAEALLMHGDWRGAQEQLEQALTIVDTYGERIYLPQLYSIEAAIADARGDPITACACMRRAVSEARMQQSPWLELITLLELCTREDATAQERGALAALVNQLPEASDTPVIAKARALLASGTI